MYDKFISICILCILNIFSLKLHSEETKSWDELHSYFKCPKWFEEARFGVWLHWGAQSVPLQGGGWYARHMYMSDVKGEFWGKDAYPYHCKVYGHPSKFGFKDIIHLWKAEKLNTDSLMCYIKSLGAKYFMIMANHHDHFDNFDSKYHKWNSVNVGPKRDIVGDFEKSAKKYGLPFGVTCHDDRFMDWWLPAFGCDKTGKYAGIPYDGNLTKEDGVGKWWEGLDPAELYGIPPSERTPEWVESIKENWLLRHIDLVTKYDIDILWFDGVGFPYGEYGKRLCTAYYNYKLKDNNIDALILAKIENESLIVKDIERGGALEILPNVWQGTVTFNRWFYREEKPRHNARTIIEMLIDMISKNGNMLLNIELKPDGTIPASEKEQLDEIGKWIKLNNEAIYGSKPWRIYGDNLESKKSMRQVFDTDVKTLEENNELLSENFNERTIDSPEYSHSEVRFTFNNGYLYIFVLNPNEGILNIPSLGLEKLCSKIVSIEMIGSKLKINFNQNVSGLIFDVPKERPNKYATVFKISF